jgi:hypothetical protein
MIVIPRACGGSSTPQPKTGLREAIHFQSFRDGALAPDLRCAIAHRGISRFRVRCYASPRNDSWMRNDGWTHLRDPAARFRPRFADRSAPKRAWGMPGAQCTRSLVCESSGWNAHEYSQRVHRNHPASPRNGLRLIPRSPWRPGFLATIAGGKLCRLDTSVGVSGPHGFAVRVTRRSSRAHPRPPHPGPRS